AEVAGATTIAAVMFGKVNATDKKTVCVVSGGNIDVTTISRVITKGLNKTGRLTEISTKIVDKPGNLIKLLQVIAKTGANIINITHSREDKNSDVVSCIVTMVLETLNLQHVDDIERELIAGGYEIIKK
ncbi:MAG: threonine ammonia-lyase, partial [Oscillospiraceae bacterium]|nr:threonine ammonia-lyase [Oscillospiraceae bacterium]